MKSKLQQHGTYHYNEFVHDRHRFLERRFPSALWSGDPHTNQIALTFDDGPSSHDLHNILRVLDENQAVATFFFIGEKVASAAHLVREVADAGHQIAMHGYRHRPFTSIKPVLLRAELALAQTLIARVCGWQRERVRDVRPPFGMFTPATLALLERWKYRPVMWSLVPFHWQFAAERTVDQLRRRLSSGSIVVLHEDMRDGPSVVGVLDTLLHIAREANLRTISIDEMWQSHRHRHTLPFATEVTGRAQ